MKNRVFAFSLSLILITAAFISPSLANSAPRFWQGTDTSGVIAATDDCPLTVERETLTFDIGEFPDTYYESEKGFLAYAGKVSAEYVFRNPTQSLSFLSEIRRFTENFRTLPPIRYPYLFPIRKNTASRLTADPQRRRFVTLSKTGIPPFLLKRICRDFRTALSPTRFSAPICPSALLYIPSRGLTSGTAPQRRLLCTAQISPKRAFFANRRAARMF